MKQRLLPQKIYYIEAKTFIFTNDWEAVHVTLSKAAAKEWIKEAKKTEKYHAVELRIVEQTIA